LADNANLFLERAQMMAGTRPFLGNPLRAATASLFQAAKPSQRSSAIVVPIRAELLRAIKAVSDIGGSMTVAALGAQLRKIGDRVSKI
jgi:hypothetical protein